MEQSNLVLESEGIYHGNADGIQPNRFGGLQGYGLTTAQILYRLPDHPSLLQTYVWQDYDLCPKFPALNRFLAFWLETLEGPLHSVTVAHSRLIRPAEIRAVNGEFGLH
jgi:uncharacterized protein Usg